MPEYDDIAAIGAGYNVALLDLDLITSLSVSSVPFLRVLSVGGYRRGNKRTKANGVPDRDGFKSTRLVSGFMTLAQFDYLLTTYEGAVTMYTWLGTTAPVRYNAVLDMGDVADYEAVNTTELGWGLQNVVWSLTRIEVLA